MVEAPSPAAAEAEGPAPAAKEKKKDKGEDDDDEDHDDHDMTDEQKEAMIKTREAWPLERKCVYALCVGLTNGRVIWSGDATTDFVFFLEQSHVILSIFRSHRRHPMRMWQRIAFLYCTMCLAFTSSVYIANNFVQSTNMYSDGWYYGAVIVSAIIAVLYQMLLVHIAICPCFRRDASMSYFTDNGRDKKKKWYVMFSGRALLWVFVGISSGILALGIDMISAALIESVMVTWLVTQVTSWFTGVGTSIPTFYFTWVTQKEAYDGKEEDTNLFPIGLGPKYPDWKFTSGTKFLDPKKDKEKISALVAELEQA